MKWIKASERLPEETLAKTYVGKNQYGAYDLFMWDNMMKFFRPYQHEYGEMIEWLDESPSGEQGEQGELYRMGEWQRCPLCEGHGQILADGFTSLVYQPCPTCQGNRIIQKPIIEGKLSSPPPEGQDEYKQEREAEMVVTFVINNWYKESMTYQEIAKELLKTHLLIKK